MEHAIKDPLSSEKEKVTLYLLGIDKKWVRGESNQWVEYVENELPEPIQETLQEQVHEAVKKTKRWWQFWKRE